MKKFQQKQINSGSPEFFSFREEYLAAKNGAEKSAVLIKFGIIFVDWRENLVQD